MAMFRLKLIGLLVAPWIMVAAGCANLRLPAIDPSGQRFFLPSPNYTTVADDSPVRRILPRGETPRPGPYEPALFNRHRDHFSDHSMAAGVAEQYGSVLVLSS